MPHRPLPAASLTSLARDLDAEAEARGWDMPPSIVQVTAHHVVTAPIVSPRCSIDELVALDPPPDVIAVGLVAEAIARGLDEPIDRDPAGAGARSVVLVDRSGATGSVLRRRDQPPEAMTPWPAGTSGGRVHDLCRLALALPTPPPAVSTLDLWAIVWLDRIVTAACDNPATTSTWRDVAGMHPAFEAFAPQHATETPLSIEDLVQSGQVLAGLHGWDDLRCACATSRLTVTGLRPHWAERLDDGAFSRWVLGTFPAARELRDVVDALVPLPTAACISEALDRWEVD